MLRLLLVDVDEAYLEALAERLEAEGCEVESVTSAGRAVATLEARTFDVMLVERMMPGVDGEEIARQIRGRREWDLMPIVMLTSAADVRRIPQGLLSPGVHYLSKTTPFEALVEGCRQLIAVHRG